MQRGAEETKNRHTVGRPITVLSDHKAKRQPNSLVVSGNRAVIASCCRTWRRSPVVNPEWTDPFSNNPTPSHRCHRYARYSMYLKVSK